MIGLLKIATWFGLSLVALLLTFLVGGESIMPFIFTFIGSPFVLFADTLSGSGFTFRYHYVSTPTPKIIWHILGKGCWITAGVWLIILAVSN